MTPDQINIAIAEAVGWKRSDIWQYCNYGRIEISSPNFKDSRVPAFELAGETRRPEKLPNYHSDLNAIHEAEATLTDEQYSVFSDRLYDIQFRDIANQPRWQWLSSTAPQRCEAFLKVKGLWK